MAKQSPEKWQSRIVGYADVDPNELLANPANWRVHPKAQQDALSGVLSEVGWVQAVVVNKTTGHVVDGHLRVSLALSRDEATIPVVLVELTEDEEKLVLATIDPIAAMAVADKEQLDELLKGVNSDSAAVQELIAGIAEANGLDYGAPPAGDPGAAMDRAAELQAKWNTARGQIWQVGRHRVMCGDSTSAEDVAALMDGEKAALLWTDPPYHVGKVFEGDYHEGREWDSELQSAWLDVALQVLSPSAQRYICFAQAQSINAINCYLPKRLLIWCKPFALMRANEWDWAYEFIAWCYDTDKPMYFDKPRGTASFDWQNIPSVIHGQEGKHHITQKPIALPSGHIEASMRLGEIVYDPFLGSGTTAVAAEQLGRICYGMDIEPKYVAVTLERLSGMGLTPELVTTGQVENGG